MTEEAGREYTGPDVVEAPSPDQSLYQQAVDLYAAGHYAAALEKFRELYVTETSADAEGEKNIKWNMAMCYARLGDLANARDFTAAYLADKPLSAALWNELALYYCATLPDISRFPWPQGS